MVRLAPPSRITRKKKPARRVRAVVVRRKPRLAAKSVVRRKPARPRIVRVVRTTAHPRGIEVACQFTGKEPSPKGLGRCAHNESAIGIVARGRDGHMWVVRKRVNGSKYWARVARAKRA